MFTGIIEAVGKINSIQSNGIDASISVFVGKMSLHDVQLGDSIAVNGVCLTVTSLNPSPGGGSFVADVSGETLSKTILGEKKSGDAVNLEKALMPTSRLGGHIVSGHVDGVGKIVDKIAEGRSVKFRIKTPKEMAKYIAAKGSVCINGISLTINEVDGNVFGVNVIPQTLSETTLNSAKIGEQVNLEADIIARYLERLLLGDRAADESVSAAPAMSLGFLAENGFIT